jgi:predicted phage tail component-like protein
MSVTFTFNSVTSTTMGLTVIDVIKPVMPGQSVKLIDIPKFPVLTQSSKKFSQNIITVQTLLVGSSPADLVTKLEALGGYLYSDDDKELSFDDQTDRYWNAQFVERVEVKRTYRYCFLDLIFSCNDPFAYDNTATTDTQESFNVVDDTYSITNSGSYYAYPIITIFFNQEQTHIYIDNNSVANSRLDISKSFSMSDELVIDCKNMTVKLNGTADYSGLGDGGDGSADFMMLAAGANTIQCGTDDATIDVDVTISFNKVYLY